MSDVADREFRLEIFKLLRAERRVFVQEFEHKREIIAGLRGHSEGELRQALHDLTTLGLAMQMQHDIYEILDKGLDSTPDEYYYGLIKDYYEKNRDRIKRHRRFVLTQSLLILGFLATSMLVVFAVQYGFVSGYAWGIPFGILLILLLVSYVWGKSWQPLEKRLGTRLVDAYLLMREGNRAGANRILGDVSRTLQGQPQRYVWDTLNRDRKRLAKLGSNLQRIVIPAVANEAHKRHDVGEVVLRIACLLLDSSPENIQRAVQEPQAESSVYGSLPIPEEKKREIAPSIRDQLSNWRKIRSVRFLVALAVLSLVVFLLTSLYSSFLGIPIQFSTAEFAGICIGILTATVVLDRFVLAPNLG